MSGKRKTLVGSEKGQRKPGEAWGQPQAFLPEHQEELGLVIAGQGL